MYVKLIKKEKRKKKAEKIHILTITREFCRFSGNNRVFLKRDHTFKKYQPKGKFIFRQIVAKNHEFCQFSKK